MPRPIQAGIRLGGIIIALALVLQFVQPTTRVFAQGITLTPQSNPAQPGTSVKVDGTGFANTETITFKFDSTPVGTTPATVTTGTGGGFSNAYFTIPGGASNGNHTVTATGSTGDHATANLLVGPGTTQNPSLSISKTVDGYPCAPGQCAANPGETLTYQLSISNTGGPTATGVVVSDTLQVGQTFLDATPSVGTCTTTNNGDGTVTVNCSIGTLNGLGSAGSTASVVIRTKVNGSVSSISNTAYTGGTGSGTTNASNTTTVSIVSGGNPCTANYQCGNPCYPYTTNTCQPNSCYPYTATPCTSNPCYPYATGTCNPNPCYSYACNPYPTTCGTCNPYPTTCGTCNPYPTQCGTCNPYPTQCGTCNPYPTTCATYCNAYGGSTYCGVVTAYTPAGYATNGSVYMGNANYPVAPGTTFPGVQVTPGQYYCFLYGQNQYITGCLSILPTGLDDGGGKYMAGREVLD